MRVALIQSDSRNDGVALHAARALRARGHDPTLIVPQYSLSPRTPACAPRWRAEGFAWIPVSAARLEPRLEHFPRDHALATARRLADLVAAFDAGWFFERHWAMPALRARRFRDRLLPVIVLDADAGPDLIPNSLEQINRAAAAQYATRWTDGICSGAAGLDSNISLIEDLWRERICAPVRDIRRASTSPAVAVCIPYFESPALLPEVLRSLDRQTSNDFTVIVVDDGSRSETGRRSFDACAEQYAGRGWKFIRQENRFPGAARNRAARDAQTEFLLFLDADDIAMPSMVDRFLRAALLAGDDCLVAPNYTFRQDPEGPCELLYDPPGSLIGSMGDDMHGGSCIFVRREAFFRIGAFTELRGIGCEDYEFHVRCNLQGLQWDVLPDFVYRYRTPPAGGVSVTTPRYESLEHVRRLYVQRLLGTGLEQLPLAIASTYWWVESNSEQEGHLRRLLAGRQPRLSAAKDGLRLLLLTSYFPYGAMSGWHKRVQEMIRYFGSRYRLTLVVPSWSEPAQPALEEALPYLYQLRCVEMGNQIPVSGDLPFRLRERYIDSIQAALRVIPTNQYHAALIDQIFMAEFRHDIDTLPVLTEHNIESRLLRQAAGHAWGRPLPKFFQDSLIEAERMEKYERRTWPEFRLRAATSKLDQAHIDRHCNQGRTVVAPNGADPSSWLPSVRFSAATVLFPAQLRYLPNVDAAEFLVCEIWPHVRKRKPDARLILAGRDPDEAVQALARSTAGVELVANPETMRQIAERASLTVAPLRLGSGTRIKILESMAWGLPVVSTSLGCEGIELADGVHLLIRDDPREFAEAIVWLMSDAVQWEKLRQEGRELTRERYSWDRVFQPLEEALIELVS